MPPLSDDHALLDQRALIAALHAPACYRHPVRRIRHIETHISHILLTGRGAYKIKKPVDLGFLDFTSLQARHYYCEEEVRLNRRLAPGLYRTVVPICGELHAPRVGGTGPLLEYAVAMSEFPQAALLSRRLERGRLVPDALAAVAARVAAFHDGASRAARGASFGSAALLNSAVHDNFARIEPYLHGDRASRQLAILRDWNVAALARHASAIDRRRDTGFVRECHGDLHVGNVAWLDDAPCIFDCIEFSPALRWIDVMNEAAFFVMDLECRGHAALAWTFLNAYLAATGDYDGVELLALFENYRALVRAKVNLIRAEQFSGSGAHAVATLHEAQRYLDYALALTRQRRPLLLLMHGLSGSCKTTMARALAASLPALLVRSDLERKRLAGVRPLERVAPERATELYSPATSRRTLDALVRAADVCLRAGLDLIVDAASLSRDWRDRLHAAARRLDAVTLLVSCEAPLRELERRVTARERRNDDASDATVAVVLQQVATAAPLESDELGRTIRVDTERCDVGAAVRRIRAALPAYIESGGRVHPTRT